MKLRFKALFIPLSFKYPMQTTCLNYKQSTKKQETHNICWPSNICRRPHAGQTDFNGRKRTVVIDLSVPWAFRSIDWHKSWVMWNKWKQPCRHELSVSPTDMTVGCFNSTHMFDAHHNKGMKVTTLPILHHFKIQKVAVYFSQSMSEMALWYYDKGPNKGHKRMKVRKRFAKGNVTCNHRPLAP